MLCQAKTKVISDSVSQVRSKYQFLRNFKSQYVAQLKDYTELYKTINNYTRIYRTINDYIKEYRT